MESGSDRHLLNFLEKCVYTASDVCVHYAFMYFYVFEK